MPNCSKECAVAQKRRYYQRHPGGGNAKALWTADEDARVKDPRLTDAELSRLLGRSMRAIQVRRNKLRAHEDIPSKSTPDDGIPYETKRDVRKESQRLVLSGALKRKPCEICGTNKSEIHHPDYSQPSDVVWLCAACHDKEHIEELKHIRSCI